MASSLPAAGFSPPDTDFALTPSLASVKPPRILACSMCQQKKVRCDRKNPCANCVKANVECVQVTSIPRRRGRKFMQRDLLDRLRKYEDLLSEHNVKFEPLLKEFPTREGSLPSMDDGPDSENDHQQTSKDGNENESFVPRVMDASLLSSERSRSFWKAINQEFRNPEHPEGSSEEEIIESTIQNAWDQLYNKNNHDLFNAALPPGILTSLHPKPAHIFRLWQIYLDNINPLLKITHSPTVQQQLIEACGNLGEVSRGFEALMFGIYCAALLSITDEECLNVFGERRDELNLRYRGCCHHALVKADFLRTVDVQVLSALVLYLLSIRQSMDPRSLSTMTGIAVRIGQRLGLDTESCNKRLPPFDAEMRRRLWWQIILFDTRIGEMANSRVSTLTPAWDCSVPSNLNDSDLFPNMRSLPTSRIGLTESLFITLRCEIADFVRHAPYHLDFFAPRLKRMAREYSSSRSSSLDELEKMLEEKYFKYCDNQVPLHFISVCMSRNFVGKARFSEYVVKNLINVVPRPQVNRERLFHNIIRMIEMDTEVQTSPFTKGFRWFTNFQFPFPAYVYMLQELRRVAIGPIVDRAWGAIANNSEARDLFDELLKSSLSRPFGRVLIKAWEVREQALKEVGDTPMPPKIIANIRAMIIPEEQSGWPELHSQTTGPGSSLMMQTPADLDRLWVSGINPLINSTASDDINQVGVEAEDWGLMNNIMGNLLYPGGLPRDENGNSGLMPFGTW